MDIVLIVAALTAGLAGFYVVLGLQGSVFGTRDLVRSRAIGQKEQSAPTLNLYRPDENRHRRFNIVSGQTELDLIRAGWAIRVSEYVLLRLFMLGAFALLAIFFASMLSVHSTFVRIAFLLLGAIVGYMLPARYVVFRKERRLKAIENELSQTLTNMAKSLRAGLGLLQALDYAARETTPPLGPELHRTLRDLQLGGDPEVVFDELNRRVGSRDLEIVTTAIMIQRTVGGNLSEILSTVSNTIRERRELKSEVQTLTSMQRLQGNLTALIPVAISLLFFAINPGVANLLVGTTTGQIALTIGTTFELLGLWLIRRLSVIEV